MAESTPKAILKFQLGIDNRSREYEISDGSARSIVNMDVANNGGLRCRDGLRLVASGNCNSLFSHSNGYYALFVKDGSLCNLVSDGSITVLTSVAGPVVYTELNDEVYWSDGVTVGRVFADGAIGNWGLPSPPAPVTAVVSGFGLDPGRYYIAMTAVQIATGLESGASEPVLVELTSYGGIQVTAPTAAATIQFNVYATPVYGAVGELRHVITVDPGVTTVLSTSNPGGKRLRSLLAIRPYPSSCLTTYKGRIWAASENVVWYSSEQSPHWLFPETGFYSFDSDVLMLGSADDGVYVGLADRVYYLQGSNPSEAIQRLVSSDGVMVGCGERLPTDVFMSQGGVQTKQCAWWDSNGRLCVGKPGGIIVKPSGDKYAAGNATNFSSTYYSHNGIRQWVSILRSNNPITGSLQAIDS